MKRILCFLLLLPLFVTAADYKIQPIIDLYNSTNETEKMFAKQYIIGVLDGINSEFALYRYLGLLLITYPSYVYHLKNP